MDHASHWIVDRLGRVLEKPDKAENSSSRSHGQLFNESTKKDEQNVDTREVAPRTAAENPAAIFSSNDVTARYQPNDELILDEKIMTPLFRTSLDAVLDWPIF